MCRLIRFLKILAKFPFVVSCTTLPETAADVVMTLSAHPTDTLVASLTIRPPFTPKFSVTEMPKHIPGNDDPDCSSVERLLPDSIDVQQILDEFIANYQEQYPMEYMGMAILESVYRLEGWGIVMGSIAGEGKDVIAVRQTAQGYQIAEFIHATPLEWPEDLEQQVIQPSLVMLPEAPEALFTCLDRSWLLGVGYPREPADVFQLAYISADDFTTEGVTEIHALLAESDSHPDWSPDGTQIVFDSWRSGKAEIYIMQSDGSDVRQLTEGAEDNSKPKWSPDWKWIA